jgi:ubiquinone/menaquinone biosynthesis C-methylase UbiE
MSKKITSAFFRVLYWYISKVDKNADITFMNYGYSNNGHEIHLEEKDKKNKYSAQLYNLVASDIELKGKNILEVGCGRGGGLSYIKRYLSPNKVTGVDLDKTAIKFCKKHYEDDGITFLQGNAELLEFENNSFDALLNVESSHRYSAMDKFLNEVHRVLKPEGHFLFADFRHKVELENLHKQLKNSNFKLLSYNKITSNVLEALNLSTSEREKLIPRVFPKFMHRIGKKFAATVGTPTYNKFASNEFEYFYFVLAK